MSWGIRGTHEGSIPRVNSLASITLGRSLLQNYFAKSNRGVFCSYVLFSLSLLSFP
jgi:hypothetical protein